ncbi:hypothetical protein AB4G91_02650 [Macrococcoides goetzii]|uniref:hypothetical protein n=1 Tax=Macrococcus sp. PK TaxID=2801919 RepID=UPI001F0F14E3|nr:hypothetical protein [Macrococcus sp. PK]MCH4984199.1 hypothetical protein [Macrococcus sp. PK]
MKKLLASALSLSILLAGCGQEENKEETKKEVKKEVVKKEVVKKDKANDKKAEDAKKKIKEQKEKVTTEQPTTEEPTTEINTQSTETPSTEQVQQNNNKADVKTNEFGEKIIGYTADGTEIIGYAPDGTPIVDEMRKQPTPVVQPSDAEQAEFRKNLPNGLSSGEIQLRNLILNGQYTEPDAQERLAEINSLEARYGK